MPFAGIPSPDSLHTVFCAECTNNFVWKDAGVFYTHRMLGTKGKITRLLACTEEQRRVYPQKSMDLGPTFVHPNYANNPHNHESSGSYNKPASVMHWVREAKIDETYVLFIDADMLLRAPIDPLRLGASRGMVLSEHVGYLDQGINNHLVENFVPHEGMAKLARAAGWYHIFHLEDLKQIAPRWLHYCEVMRSNPQRYWDMNGSKAQWHPLARRAVGTKNYIPTGDAYVQFGEPPWISEMYGYIFAAAEQGIETKLLNGLVEYTDYTDAARPPQGPTIIHYGLHCHVDSYHFTKYDYRISTWAAALHASAHHGASSPQVRLPGFRSGQLPVALLPSTRAPEAQPGALRRDDQHAQRRAVRLLPPLMPRRRAAALRASRGRYERATVRRRA